MPMYFYHWNGASFFLKEAEFFRRQRQETPSWDASAWRGPIKADSLNAARDYLEQSRWDDPQWFEGLQLLVGRREQKAAETQQTPVPAAEDPMGKAEFRTRLFTGYVETILTVMEQECKDETQALSSLTAAEAETLLMKAIQSKDLSAIIKYSIVLMSKGKTTMS